MKNKILYKKFEQLIAWSVIDQAISDLAENTDIIEQTDRRYIVGYLLKKLSDNKLLATQKDGLRKT